MSPTSSCFLFLFRMSSSLFLSSSSSSPSVITDHHYSNQVLVIDWMIDDRLYSAYSPLSWADSLRSYVVLHEWQGLYSAFFFFFFFFLNIKRSGVLTALAWLVPHETAAVSAQVLCTPYNHAPCHFTQSHIRKVYACLAVTCHLYPVSYTHLTLPTSSTV